ncbi:amidase family protein [Amycolatopsis minnesotensis]|uniref:Amidase n=1 Tax=Amycolatopsis minnesotensis TaxID=337894 RepID=A0ABP5DEY7_9PSEU
MDTEFEAMTAREQAEGIRTRQFSARELLDAHLARIAEVNPAINAVVTLDEEGARAAATAADERTMAGGPLGPLHGVPMTHKDTHDTAGMRTTFGSPLHRDRVPAGDSLVIARLKAAGVITTGKTNVPEFAAGSHTFNPVFGTTVNPYDPSKSAGGSSGGTAAAIAARIQPAGDGSDMGGSVRTPAAFCNLAGLRPSAGRIPAEEPYSWLGRAGVLARRTSDVAYVMACVSGPDRCDPAALPEPGSLFDVALRENLTGVRIGWTPGFGLAVPVEPEVLDVLAGVLPVFERLGATVEEACPDLRDADEVFSTTRAFDLALKYGDLLPEHRGEIKDSLVWNLEKGLALTVEDLMSATRARRRLHTAVTGFFGRYDLLIAPATQVLPFPAELEYPRAVGGTEFDTYLGWMRAATLVSATGLPALSVPAGFSGGLPVGLQIVGAHGADLDLLHAANAFELATGFAATAPPS